jgi:hypothetical protein
MVRKVSIKELDDKTRSKLTDRSINQKIVNALNALAEAIGINTKLNKELAEAVKAMPTNLPELPTPVINIPKQPPIKVSIPAKKNRKIRATVIRDEDGLMKYVDLKEM